jgi:small conductance mechanosensitive channel
MNTEKLIELAKNFVLNYGPKLIAAIAVLVIGLMVIKAITKGVQKIMQKRELEPSLQGFLKSIVNISLKIMLVITALGMLGIEMTSFIAILGAAGLAIGMALSGTLQNFAGGVMLLIFKPFKVGDYIEAQGHSGSVHEIQIFNTILKSPDNKTIIIPNGGLSTGSMVNYSTEDKRRVDITFGIGYGDDVDKAKSVIQSICDADDRILKDPALFIAVSALADSSVNLAVRAWVDSKDYWGVHFRLQEEVYKVFDKEGLNIPYPQMDLHIHKQ